MGQLSGLWTKGERRNCVWRTNLDPGMVRSVKELLDHAYKLRRYSGVVKPQLVWYMATGREDSTPAVLEP
jgi:hypothetical protein